MNDAAELAHFLEVNGADAARWSAHDRAEVERLLASDQGARRVFERAKKLDGLIAIWGASSHRNTAAADRVIAALPRPLPPQRWLRPPKWWPTDLLDRNFAPAWPRIAVLVAAGLLGFAIGLSAFAPTPWELREHARHHAQGADLIAIIAEPELLTEIGL